jgi:hypothetical protein
MNSKEMDAFSARLHRFTSKGLRLDQAERLASKLVERDREMGDWLSCLECAHLQGYGRWSCANSKRAGVVANTLPADFVTMLQRCGPAASHFYKFDVLT